MFSNIKIGRRLLLLIGVLALTFLVTAVVTFKGVLGLSSDIDNLNQKSAEAAEFSRLSGTVRYSLIDVSQQLSSGALTWQEAASQLEAGAEEFDRLWTAHNDNIAGKPKLEEFFIDAFATEAELVNQGFSELLTIVSSENRGQLTLYLLNDASGYTDPFLNAADALTTLGSIEAREVFLQGEANSELYLYLTIAIVIIGFLLAATLGPVIYFSITNPIKTISGVVERVSEGNLEARTQLESQDELGQLGNAFDNMLNERVSTMAQAETDNDNINDSVIRLLEAVSDLSELDLTVKVPVAEDVTGPVADAMNLLASETSRVLAQIREVSVQVADAANAVQSQGSKVTSLAQNERIIVEDTMGQLDQSAKTMTLIAKMARVCNDTATKASSNTRIARDTVAKTATGMNEIRETISETEKRIKRLGERSQEINGVVAIINNIAERTHVLALNASMQAAAAGEAGRGFAVVADEVQRLAESSRQSTSEIAGLVSNIQAETAETMATMNKTISQVVEGTELAEASGVQMESTEETTSKLAQAVAQIAKRSLTQAQVSNELRKKAAMVQKSTQDTSTELANQEEETSKLVAYSKQLVDSVRVFKLPA